MVDEIIWTSGAIADLQAIFSHLEDRYPGSGVALVERADHLCTLLRDFPELGKVYLNRTRRLLLGRRQQYGLLYSLSGKRIAIVGFVDLRRDPKEIARILRERGAC